MPLGRRVKDEEKLGCHQKDDGPILERLDKSMYSLQGSSVSDDTN